MEFIGVDLLAIARGGAAWPSTTFMIPLSWDE
jgi:hypothetical protein